MIHVYCIRTDKQSVSVSALEPRIASIVSILPAVKRDRILHIRPSLGRIHSALGWCLLQFAFHDCGYTDFALSQLLFVGNRKPRWEGTKGDFNLSHSAALIACAVSEAGRVGIDCERIRTINSPALLRRIQSPLDRTSSDADPRTFFHLWTQKEAVIKAEGNGGVWDMRHVSVDDAKADYRDLRWYLYSVACGDDYVTHIASDIADQSITMRAVSIEQLLGDTGTRDQRASMD